MKLIGILLSVLILMMSCHSVSAQPRPIISTRYSNAEIEQMINLYQGSSANDVVPTDTIHSRFTADFPEARHIEWEVASDIYEVEFEIGRIDYDAYYDKEGNLLKYVVKIKEREIPAIVKNAAIAKYPDYTFDDLKEIRVGTDIFYKVELEKNKTDIKMLIKSDGVIQNEIYD